MVKPYGKDVRRKEQEMRRWSQALAVVIAVTLLASQVGISSEAFAASRARSMPIKVGTLTGTVTDTTAKAVVKTIVTVLDKKGKVIASAVTDKKGKFVLKNLVAGNYKLSFGKKLSYDITVTEKAKTSKLNVIVPSKEHYSAGQWSTTTWIWIGIGAAVVATAIVVPIAVSNARDRRKKRRRRAAAAVVVSP